MGCPGAGRGNCGRLAQLVEKKIAVAVTEVGEGLFEGGVVVDALLNELQPLLGLSQDFGQ